MAENKIELIIQNQDKYYLPCVEGDIVWQTERKGMPGKLTFNVMKDEVINFTEGNPVRLKVNDNNTFYGFVFTKARSKTGIIAVTAYDQLRYLKNKDTYVYKNNTADELVRKIADDFNLQAGELAGTGFKIAQRIEENKTLFDIILNALDITLQNTKKLYVLYDDFGKLALKDISGMKLDLLIDSETAENLDYKTSIDSDTYNKIKLFRNNEEAGKREVFISQDGSNINSWGVLQFFDELGEVENGKAKADALLGLYNQKSRSLSIKKAFGDIRVRGGSSVAVSLNLGDMIANTYMVVEKVKHTINTDTHFMDLTLRGNRFV